MKHEQQQMRTAKERHTTPSRGPLTKACLTPIPDDYPVVSSRRRLSDKGEDRGTGEASTHHPLQQSRKEVVALTRTKASAPVLFACCCSGADTHRVYTQSVCRLRRTVDTITIFIFFDSDGRRFFVLPYPDATPP